MSLFAILCGTLPIGYTIWPNIISYIIGWIITAVSVYFLGRRVVNATGSFSPFIEAWARWVKKGDSELEVLRVDTVKAFQEEDVDTVVNKEDGSEEDDLVKTNDEHSMDEEAHDFHDVESPDEDEGIELAEEAVPVDSMVQESFHLEASYGA